MYTGTGSKWLRGVGAPKLHTPSVQCVDQGKGEEEPAAGEGSAMQAARHLPLHLSFHLPLPGLAIYARRTRVRVCVCVLV